jgi:hypothetical protein
MEPEFMADAYDDLAADRAESSFALDSEIAQLCDDAAVWLAQACMFALARHMTLAQFLAELLLIEQATSCGYLATASRGRRTRSNAIAAGVDEPRRRKLTLAERTAAEVRAWGNDR